MRMNLAYPSVCWLRHRSVFQAVSQFAFKNLLVHSVLFPEGEIADLQAGQFPQAF